MRNNRGLLLGIVGGLVVIIGKSNDWPGLVIMALGVLVALLVISLMKDRPERPL